MTKDDGGPAFPAQPVMHWPDGVASLTHQCGMSMRDYFAGQVLAGWTETYHRLAYEDDQYGPDRIAAVAYQIADAMLEVRESQ